MFAPQEVSAVTRRLGLTHVVWVPDSVLGTWEQTWEQTPEVRLVRVCREGEVWATAAGLYLGGANPLVVMQSTGLFESGDALRNVLFDMKLPLYGLIGYRNYLNPDSPDTARRFLEPILRAWELEYRILSDSSGLEEWAVHYESCRQRGCPGVALVPEGKG